MIVTLEIDKLEPATYEAHALVDRVEVCESSTYTSLENAIAEEAGAVPVEIARFMEVRYAGISSGTHSCTYLREHASQVADRMIGVLAEMHQVYGH